MVNLCRDNIQKIDSIFNTVKEKMGRRKFKTTRRKTAQVLSGLLVCGKCGEPCKIVDYYRGKYPYYRCSTKVTKGKDSCDNRNLRGDELDELILKKATSIIFSKENLSKYKDLISKTVKDEKKERQNRLSTLSKEQKEIERKKSVYFDGIESGKLDMDLVADRLKTIKEEEEKITRQKIEADKRLFELPEIRNYTLTKNESQNLKESLQSFVNDATSRQKRLFLSQFIQSIIIHSDKISVKYFPPIYTNKKSPDKGQSFLELPLASPRGFEPLLPA